jgi:HSP20 family molecular chaperone IbpA
VLRTPQQHPVELLDPLSEVLRELDGERAESAADLFPRWQAEVSLQESPERLVIRVDVPHLHREQVRVRLAGDLLTLEADRRLDGGRAGRGFVRSFLLPVAVPPEAVDAVLSDGVLVVTVDKRRPARRRRIPLA